MALTLSTLRDRIEVILRDATNAKWSTIELDEAIRQALQVYSERIPQRAITTVTLSAATREVSLASLSYRTIERVWWDYNAASPPEYPPRWRPFEVWPGSILYLDGTDQPQAGDVVRIWYTAAHTLNGLDSATATTLWEGHATLLARGATGYAASSRGVEILEKANVSRFAEKNLIEWGQACVAEFLAALDALAAREAARQSGVAPMGALDRWDGAEQESGDAYD